MGMCYFLLSGVCDCSAGMCSVLPQLITCSTAVLIRTEGVVKRTEPPATCRHCFLREAFRFHFLLFSHSSVLLRAGNIISSYFCCIVFQENFPEWVRNLVNKEGDTEFFAFGVLLLLQGLSVCTVPGSLNLPARQTLDPLLIYCLQLITQVD